MSDTSPTLQLPLIQPSQAQKHVTHNEAIMALDHLVHLRLHGLSLTAPPEGAEIGQVFDVGAGASASWEGKDGLLAIRTETGWTFDMPQDGWIAVLLSTGMPYLRQSGVWQPLQVSLDGVDKLGIRSNADETNRLVVAGEASLLTHGGAGHQLKINKASGADTASLLFQSGWSGRAEIGLAGSDDFSVKLSPDGGSWLTAMQFSAADGIVSGSAIQAAPTDTSAGRLARADYVFGPGNLVGSVSQDGGMPSGAVFERGGGANSGYLRMADGTQICWTRLDLGPRDTSGSGTQADPHRSAEASYDFPVAFSSTPSLQLSASCESSNVLARHIVVSCGTASAAGVAGVCAFAGVNPVSDSTPVTAHLVATGRWY